METNVNNTFFTGKFLIHLPSVDSTNNYAKEYIAKSTPIDGTVILADEQSAGRGQSGTVWLADANKNLTFSIIYHTRFLRATEQFYLSMAVSLGVKYAVESIQDAEDPLYATQMPTKIKWPNDIYVGNKKIAGVLIENTISGMHLKYSVIGIGLNVNQDNFPAKINATSLKLVLQQELERNKILSEVLIAVEKYFLILKEQKYDQLKKEYLENLFRFNVSATYEKDKKRCEGKIIDVDTIGNIIMETETGVAKFGFKEVNFVIT